MAEVMFKGTAGMHERIIDFGNGIGRYDDAFLISRWGSSSRLYAAITEQVRCGRHCQCNKHGTYVTGDMCQHDTTPHLLTC